jgi:hypothetical protein
MKYNIFTIIFVLSAYTANAQYNFSKIEYYYNPVNFGNKGIFCFYKLNLNSDRTAKLIYSIQKDSESGKGEALIYNFTISDEAKIEINRLFNENKIIETENQFAEDKEFENIKQTEFARISYVNVVPEGSMMPVVLKTMSTPIFPKKEFIENLKSFYEKINAAVPGEIWEKTKKAK